MDPYTESLLERTRQRREMLNQKMGKTPEPAPRKRFLEESTSENIKTSTIDKDSPGKRQCLREAEESIKPDTPAISSVRSRMKQLTNQQEEWAMENGVQQEGSSQNKPRPMEGEEEPQMTGTGRRGRLAKLAQNINNWEDDLSHPTIQKPVEEKKPRWQPPAVRDDSVGNPATKTNLPKSPIKALNSDFPKSPVKAHNPNKDVAPPPPPPPQLAGDPKNSPRKACAPSSPKTQRAPQPPKGSPMKQVSSPYQHQVKQVVDQRPVNAHSSEFNGSVSEPTQKSVKDRMTGWKEVETPVHKKNLDPSEQPMTAKLATWEKVSTTPAKGVSSSTRVVPPVKQTANPVTQKPPLPRPVASVAMEAASKVPAEDPAAMPVASRMASWQERASKTTPKKEEEPTAYSVNARMSAWEEMSSSNKVSHIKKVDPGKVTSSPSKSPHRPAPVPSTIVTQPPKKAVTPSKTSGSNLMSAGKQTPPRVTPQDLSPSRVGSATKLAQQRLLEQVQHSKTDDVAEKLRRERMAEVNNLNNRWHSSAAPPKPPHTDQNKPVPCETKLDSTDTDSAADDGCRRDAILTQARDDAAVTNQNSNNNANSAHPSRGTNGKGPQTPSSIYRLISQKKQEKDKPILPRNNSAKRVQFASDDSFESTEDEEFVHRQPKNKSSSSSSEEFGATESSDQDMQSTEDLTTQDEDYTDTEETDSDARGYGQQPPRQVFLDEDDSDVSLSAFVPESVRRRSVLPTPPEGQRSVQRVPSQQRTQRPTSHPVASVPSSVRTQSSSNIHDLSKQTFSRDSSSSLESTESTETQSSSDYLPPTQNRQRGAGENRKYSEYMDTDEEEAVDDIDDFLDEALDKEEEEEEKVQLRKRPRQSLAMAYNAPVYSVNEYRHSQACDLSSDVNKRITRRREFQEDIHEEDIAMPTSLPPDIERKSIRERIQELHELVSQEQSVIMQTSNALNQCCSGNSYFAGSQEQVECNRLLLLSCQKRQAYLMEIQRLKDTGMLDPPCHGPKGSLTISDIRLPLKKEFVTKIGSTSDLTVHYFLILIRNYAQVISTQLLSTHDPMMRGSLDFPNLIKLHAIPGDFRLNMEIYSMNVSKEMVSKDKKKKTPKKPAKSALSAQSTAGGAMSIRTTSFTLITTLPITMKCLDKTCFTLERIPYLSPLHGTIYMKLKCTMEQNVEEKGFLTMFEDVSGLGAWHRRWCVLAGNKLCYWKYPDDETRKEPMGFMDLKRCITEKVGLIPRDICARPNTFEMVTIRQPRKGEQDTLVTKRYNTMTTIRHMLSADTKEERINWCNKINRALANIRTWHADAMRPVKLPQATDSY